MFEKDAEPVRSVPAQRTRRLSARTVYSGRVFNVIRERWRFGDLPPVDREVIRHPGSVVIVPVLDRDRLVLIRQFRVTIRRRLWELPAGTRGAGESLRRCATRELVEETGYRARRMRLIARFLPSPGFCAETMYLFVAWHLIAGKRHPADDDPISTHVVPFKKVAAMIQRGLVLDAKTIIGVTLVFPLRGRLFV